MSENATDQDPEVPTDETSGEPVAEVNQDLWRVPDSEGATDPVKAYATDAAKLKERAILYGTSHAEFTLATMVCKECGEPAPEADADQKCTAKKCTSDVFVQKVLHIYSKSEGALERVDQAFREWYDVKQAELKKESRSWNHWGLRRRRVDKGLSIAYESKYRLFGLIFQDLSDPSKHQDLTIQDFWSMTQAMQADIWRAFTEAQNAFDLISAMFPDRDETQKKTLLQVLCPTGISI